MNRNANVPTMYRALDDNSKFFTVSIRPGIGQPVLSMRKERSEADVSKSGAKRGRMRKREMPYTSHKSAIDVDARLRYADTERSGDDSSGGGPNVEGVPGNPECGRDVQNCVVEHILRWKDTDQSVVQLPLCDGFVFAHQLVAGGYDSKESGEGR